MNNIEKGSRLNTEITLQQMLDIPMCYFGISEDAFDTAYFWDEKTAWQHDMNPYSKGYIPFSDTDYLKILLVLNKHVSMDVLRCFNPECDYKMFKIGIAASCIFHLTTLKSINPDTYQKLYDDLKNIIQENIC